MYTDKDPTEQIRIDTGKEKLNKEQNNSQDGNKMNPRPGLVWSVSHYHAMYGHYTILKGFWLSG